MIENNTIFLNEYYASEILIPPIFDVKNVVLVVQNYFPFIQMNFTWPQEDIFYKSHFGPHTGDYLIGNNKKYWKFTQMSYIFTVYLQT